jgi:hypothetical protein
MSGRGEPSPPTKSDTEIERDILHTRRRIGRTLDALSEKLAARRLLRRGVSMPSRLFGTQEPARPDTGARFRPDPLALGLIGAGVAWLVAENARLFRRRRRDAAIAIDGGDGERSANLIERNPLFTGIIGFAIGAALAIVLPPTRRERQLIAQAREGLWRTAEALGHRTATRVRDLGRRSSAAAADRSTTK